MADNTRVNELQEKLLQAMDILNAHALSGMSFDKTITCTIEDDTYKKEGKYTVNDGSRIFTAYSTDTKLRAKDTVYVTVPQGNFENQKMIIGKKADETEKPFVFTTPFDTIFDMTDNIVASKVQEGSLIANAINKYGNEGENYEYVTLYNEPCNHCGFTRLGLKANFKSWVNTATRGKYGLAIILTTHDPNTASSQQLEEQEYYYTFTNSDMYGNTYSFETDYEQQLVIPLEEIKGTITNIKINFYQEANFFDKFNEPIPCSVNGYLKEEHTNLYLKDEDGNYMIGEDDTLLTPNLFVKDIYLCLGYDISIFNNDMVQIYTQQPNTYKHSSQTSNDGIAQNRKTIKVRWVHIDNGTPIDMTKVENHETPYEIRWYRYKVGAPAADAYCGVYWTRIEGATGFSYEFDPNIDLQQEKIKVIIVYNEATPYRSNELLFENEEDLPPSAEAQHIISALTITTDDGTNGNYMIYGQDNSIKDTEYGKVQRSLSVWFDANNNGELSANEEITHMDNNGASSENYLVWTFPAQNTMIDVIDPNKIEIKENEGTENEKIIAYQIYTCSPYYKIASYYTPNKSNNTVTCEYKLNGRVYTTEKEFTFGPAGTMGTDQTLVIDFVGDVNAVNKADEADNNINIEIQLYDNQNIAQEIPDGGVQWAWYYNGDLDNGTIKFPFIIEGKTNKQITFTKDQFDIDSLYILQATVGDLTTYFPIPIQSGGYSFIKGPTQVIYQADGEPAYSREAYALYSGNTDTLTSSWVKICKTTDEDKLRYTGTIDEKTHKLKPLSIYVKDAPIYGVQAKSGTATLWTQPILVLQNQWPNGVINKWDGESLVLDEANSTILAAALSAGKKNDDNTFSGVMIGDWSDQDVEDSITGETGIYGFHHGAMSYAFKEDGTAFIGKSSMARINFNGEDATIYSSGYYENGHAGMMIDLYGRNENPYIELKSPDGKSRMKLDTANNGSTIYMSRSNGSITITNTDATYPLEIGSNFSVKWNGDITANGGTIGNWHIREGRLESNDGYIVLSTESNGSIIVGSNNSNRIKIDASGSGTINMSSQSVLTGGIIRAGTLQSNNSTNRIKLDGYLEVKDENGRNTDTFLGFVQQNTGSLYDKFTDGVGFGYGSNPSSPRAVVKATDSNVGMSFGYGGGGWIQINSTGISMGGDQIDLSGIDASDQKGIYARFA